MNIKMGRRITVLIYGNARKQANIQQQQASMIVTANIMPKITM